MRSGEEIRQELVRFAARWRDYTGCYGWPRSVAQDHDEIVRRLLALNREIVTGERPYDPFGTGEGAPARLV